MVVSSDGSGRTSWEVDVTEQRVDAFFGTILESIADGVFAVDLDQRITYFNKAAERITGIPRSEAAGRKCFDVLHASLCQGEGGCALHRTMATGKEVIDLPVDIIDARGEKVPVSISTAVLRDTRGAVVGGAETFRDLSALESLRKELAASYSFEDIISKNHEIQRIFSILPDIAQSLSTVLIEGPSGSGKELFARAIHKVSHRSGGPYVVVNCGALPENLLESELFGYRKGAFTDAVRDKPGKFSLARGGSLFLDEIGDITPGVQVKLLRVLQEREFDPLGALAPEKADVRIIAATNRPLEELVRAGRFREDLYYRLKVLRLSLPPLSKRREDIPLLAEHFVRRFGVRMGKSISGVSQEALALLLSHDYPGNIRELENIVEYACVMCKGKQIGPEHLPAELAEGQSMKEPERAPFADLVKSLVEEALLRNGGHRGKAAEELGIDRTTLWRKMKRMGLQT